MKKIYLSVIALFIALSSVAQSDVYFKLNHLLGSAPFQYGVAGSNNNGVVFDVNRLQYYISEITLLHDGGQETMVPNTWLLVSADSPVNTLLGNFSVTNLEGVRFGIGVEASVNHLDPSTYPSSHPLAPKSPSMHWGWTAGYRFVCMEGMGGAMLDQSYQVHALEDANYFKATVMTSGTVNGSDITVDLDADYEMALKDLDVSQGLFNHGGSGEAVTVLENFRDAVFSEASVVTGVQGDLAAYESSFVLAPNPAAQGRLVAVSGDFPKGAHVLVTDLSGRRISEMTFAAGLVEFEAPAPGFYLLTVLDDGLPLVSKKLMVLR